MSLATEERLNLAVDSGLDGLIGRLREALPQLFADGRLDPARLAALTEPPPERETYGLTWTGKTAAVQAIRTGSHGALIPHREESVRFDDTRNVFIEGDNLEVLKLLQKAYFGEVKLIYIDPPYNTGKEFIYSDDFRESLDHYLRYSGQKDERGKATSTSSEAAGRYHSRWLSMMYPRLFLARNLLRPDGTLFVSIDDTEVANLRLLLDEIFGQENFVAQIIWKKRGGPPNDKVIGSVHEYVLVYARDIEHADLQLLPRPAESRARYTNPDDDPRGPWVAGDLSANAKGGRYVASLNYEIVNPATGQRHLPPEGACWRFNEEKIERLLSEGRIYFGADGRGRPKLKRYLAEVRDGVTVPTLWDDLATNTTARSEIKALFGSNSVFETPKPTALIERILRIATRPGDLVLDFFAGSCSTADAVLHLNQRTGEERRFLMVQLEEALETGAPNAPEGFESIAAIGRERIRRVLAKLGEENGRSNGSRPPLDRGFRAFRLTTSNFEPWDPGGSREGDGLARQLVRYADHLVPGRSPEDVLFELLLKAGFPVCSTIEALDLPGGTAYSVADGALVACLEDTVSEELLDAIADREPAQVLCLDRAFAGDDALKTNARLTFEGRGITFRTV